MRRKTLQGDTLPRSESSEVVASPPTLRPNGGVSWSGAAAPVFRSWLKLPQKTTVILLTLLTVVISVVGGIFFFSTESMLQTSQTTQVRSFAYGLAAALGNVDTDQNMIQIQFNALDQTPNLEFVVLTDIEDHRIAGFVADANSWEKLKGRSSETSQLGQIQEIAGLTHTSYGIVVPVNGVNAGGTPTAVKGFLYVAFGTEGTASQLHFLQAFVLFTCIGVVIIAVPIASIIARNITIPIQRLALAAHTLADGDLSHRVEMTRRDELGELADAFNRMADTVQQQQQAIRQANIGLEQKVQQRTAELETVNNRLQAEIAEKEDFLRAVSHDLNAPLRNISGMASMLAIKYADTLEKDALQRLDRIQKNVQVEVELINELLELSRIKTRREKIERVDLHELITAVTEGFSSDLETRGISLQLHTHLPVMRCEKMRFRQVFQNLIDNAVKYMRDTGPKEILISQRWVDGEAVFSFEDTGMGIARDDLPNLFHVFRRAKNASVMKVPGKGVGLASVKSIIANYNGRLWADSVEGQGTAFLFAIPGSHFEVPHEVSV